MKKWFVLLTVMFILPLVSYSHQLSLRGGTFLPHVPTNVLTRPDSLWAIEFDQMSFKRSDYYGSILGISFDLFINKNFSLSFCIDTYAKDKLGYYKNYVGARFPEGSFAFPSEYYDGEAVVHAFNVGITPVQLSAKFTPLGRRGRFVPFIGAGIGYYRWNVVLRGQTVNFSDTSWVYDDPNLGEVQIYPIVQSYGRESGWNFGYHALAGLQVPIGYRITLDGEVRYHWAKAKLEEWFTGFDNFEIGGLSLVLGISFWF